MIKRITLFLAIKLSIFANPFVGYWMTQEKGYNTQAVIEVKEENDIYTGTIRYIAVVDNKFNYYGYTTDDKYIGLKLLRKFIKLDENRYRKGRVINPQNNKEYYARATVKGDNLHMRGSLDPFSILGLTRVWRRIDINDLLSKGEVKVEHVEK